MTRKIFYGHIIMGLIQHKITRYFLWALAMSIFVWASAQSRFRDAEGFPKGIFCFPVSTSVALIVLGWASSGRYRKSAFWFALALVGQATALQLIEAGPYVRYQHYKPFYRLFTESNQILLIFLLIQTVLVVAGIKNRWSIIRNWLHQNFKFWQLLCLGLFFIISSATVSKDISGYVVEIFFAAFVQAVNLGNIILIVWTIPEDTLVRLSQRFEKLFGKQREEDSIKPIGIDRFAILAAIWVTIVAGLLSFFVYERHPHVPDEFIYLQHAEYLANGVLEMPAPAVTDAFEIYLIQIDGEKWYP